MNNNFNKVSDNYFTSMVGICNTIELQHFMAHFKCVIYQGWIFRGLIWEFCLLLTTLTCWE